MLKQLQLVNFRAFEHFTVSFGDGAYLVGPNNAGKSTLLTALRAADVFLRYAYQRRPDRYREDRDIGVRAYPANLGEFPALRDSLRYEFGNNETRLNLQWRSGASLTAVWPEEEDDNDQPGFFHLTQPSGFPAITPAQVKASFPPLGVIPILGPTEHAEKLLDEIYVKRNISGRLSSRHFRNQLRLMRNTDELDAFLEWAEPWLDEISFDTLGQHMSEEGLIVEAFFYERGSRIPKEVVWAGDGVQVWLQLLYHVYRVKNQDTIILDEPEVYLHPDLQRRLVRLLDSTEKQVIVATHSAELVAESDGRLATLIDRTRRRANRPKSEGDFEMLSSTLGTAFNLRLAKALRSRVAVFVEGRDMAILRKLAKTLGLTHLVSELGVTIVPLHGYSNWGHVEPFKWICDELLPNAIELFVILDRDYRSDETRQLVIDQFSDADIDGYVWKRKELESYLLHPSVMARLSGASEVQISKWLNDVTTTMESDVFGRLLDERMRENVNPSMHAVSVTSRFKPVFDGNWSRAAYRLEICPPKKVIARLNDKLQSNGHKAVSVAALARQHRKSEIPQEVVSLLSKIESRVTSVL